MRLRFLRFYGVSLHRKHFIWFELSTGCRLDYALFERTVVDNDLLRNRMPRDENLKMRFARSLRMNSDNWGFEIGKQGHQS